MPYAIVLPGGLDGAEDTTDEPLDDVAIAQEDRCFGYINRSTVGELCAQLILSDIPINASHTIEVFALPRLKSGRPLLVLPFASDPVQLRASLAESARR